MKGTISRNAFNLTESGDTTCLNAQGAGYRIRVLAVCVVAAGATTIKFKSNNADVSAEFPVAANGGFVLPYNPVGWFQTEVNQALKINLGSNVNAGVQIVWALA